jgi:hypothetical protein
MEINRRTDRPLSDVEKALEIKLERENMVKETIATAVSKVSFVKELKQGLGAEIKANGGKVTVIKKTRYQKFMVWLKKIFTKF